MAEDTAKVKANKKGMKKVVLAVVVLAVLAAAAFLGVRYMQAQKEIQRLSNPQEASRAEADKLKADVGKLLELPADETPTVATVVDASKLKEQPFFAKSENGDKVLIFSQSRKAILYRPSTNKVIEVAPINLGNSTQSGQ